MHKTFHTIDVTPQDCEYQVYVKIKKSWFFSEYLFLDEALKLK